MLDFLASINSYLKGILRFLINFALSLHSNLGILANDLQLYSRDLKLRLGDPYLRAH